MNSKRLCAVLMLAGTAGVAKADALRPPNETQALMRQKLEAAHGLLEGLVREDFTAIEARATMLKNISRATSWYKMESPDFLQYAKSFQFAADNLVEQARAKSLEGVSLGYVRVTLSCMECHNFVRAGRTR